MAHMFVALYLIVSALQADEIILREGVAIPSVGRPSRSVIRLDAVESKIVDGTWSFPAAGDELAMADGSIQKWEPVSANAENLFQGPLFRGGYVAIRVASDRDRVMVLEAAGHSLVYVNGNLHTGDPYSNGILKIPVSMRKGENEFLFLAARGQLRVKLVEPKAIAQLDRADLTLPDFIIGQPIENWAAIPVLNSSNLLLSNAVIEATLPDGSKYSTPIGTIPPMATRKSSFQIRGPVPEIEGTITVTLRLLRGEPHELIDTTSIDLQVRSSNQTHKRTFISNIDDSVQYFGFVPAKSMEPPVTPALILTLHGASVEAIGQASAYLQKDWAHIVAPTNRRPYGFDWEDWGRLDAIEVLELAQAELRVESGRTYLTGHSMGGHGTWQLGAHFPDRFAAIGPSAGWVSFASYVGRTKSMESNNAVGEILARAALPSDTLALARNYLQHGVYVLHGDADDNVPVSEARTMKTELEKLHKDFGYHEEPGMGHWWGKEGVPGTACVDWPPMWEFFRKHTPASEPINEFEFATSNPGLSAKSHWVAIEAQVKALTLSSIRIRCEPRDPVDSLFRFSATTDNVARLSIDLRDFQWAQHVEAELDGEKLAVVETDARRRVWFRRDPQSRRWSVITKPSPEWKGPHRAGPFKDAFRHRMMFVYGTSGTEDENSWSIAKARYDAEIFWYRGNGSIDLVSDTDYIRQADHFADRGVILYGNADTNSAWSLLLPGCPIHVGRGVVRVGDREYSGSDLACLFLRAHPKSDVACVAVISASGASGQRLADRIPVFTPGVALPDYLVIDSTSLQSGLGGVRAAGFFGLDWSLTNGESAFRDAVR